MGWGPCAQALELSYVWQLGFSVACKSNGFYVLVQRVMAYLAPFFFLFPDPSNSVFRGDEKMMREAKIGKVYQTK